MYPFDCRFGGITKRGVPEELFQSWLKPMREKSENRRDLAKYLKKVPKKKTLLEWSEQQRAFQGTAVIVWAREDKLMPPKHAEQLAEHFDNTELIWVDDSRPLIPIDQPAILAGHLNRFLAPLKT